MDQVAQAIQDQLKPPPPPDLAPAFSPAKWAKLTEKARWDVMVALRGPDCKGNREVIKWFSTAVIRGALRKVMPAKIPTERVGGLINAELGLILTPAKTSGYDWGAGHFFDHVIEAAEILGIPVLRVSAPVYDQFMSLDRPVDVVKAIHAYGPGLIFGPALARIQGYLTIHGLLGDEEQAAPPPAQPEAPL